MDYISLFSSGKTASNHGLSQFFFKSLTAKNLGVMESTMAKNADTNNRYTGNITKSCRKTVNKIPLILEL